MEVCAEALPNVGQALTAITGGTAGCLLAHDLSHSAARPTVLIIEAGSKPDGKYIQAPGHRYHPVALRPDLDHGYVSEPEAALNGRTIHYTRGKGLGGSSVLNFGAYLYGSSEDYNRWADLVGDDSWKWGSVQHDFHAMENYDYVGTEAYSDLADPSKSKHGTSGLLKVGMPPRLEAGVAPHMEALRAAGEKMNLDVNSGDPTGVAMFPYSFSKDGRTTSATAYLLDPPENLEIWTGEAVYELVFEGNRVVGVVAAGGRKGELSFFFNPDLLSSNKQAASASKAVILCGGAIDTPKLLLLNGIGPKAELEAQGITVKKNLPGVGKHLQDHVLAFMSVEVDGHVNERTTYESNATLVAEAEELYKKDRTGALALQLGSLWGGFMSLPGLEDLPEYQALPRNKQAFLSHEAVPAYEMMSNLMLWPPGAKLSEGNSYVTIIAFLMNPQSEGSITLRSSNPTDKPVIKLNYLTHPYDVRLFREAIRNTWTKLLLNDAVRPHIKKTLCGPASLSDEDIDAFAKSNANTVWHANGTVKMGKKGEEGTCVDASFRVVGVEGLRVADLSVCPLTPNNHTQATAYLVGRKCGEVLVREYGLGRGGTP